MQTRVRAIACFATALALAAAGLVYRDSANLVGTTFTGFGVFPSGTVALRTISPRPDLLARYDVQPRDLITHIDGVPMPDGSAVLESVRARRAGEPLRYRLERPGGETLHRTVPAQVFSRAELRHLVLPMLGGGLLLLLSGAIGVLVRPELPAARVLFLFCWSAALNLLFLGPDYAFFHRFVPYSMAITTVLSKASLLHLGLTFPLPLGPTAPRARRRLLGCVYGLLGLQGLLYAYALGREPGWTRVFDEIAYATFAAGFLLVVGNLLRAVRFAPSEEQRQQARVVLLGPGFCLLVLAGQTVAAWLWPGVPTPMLGAALLTSVFACSLTYALLRHNLFELDAVLRRALAAALVLGAAAALYLSMFVGLRAFVGEQVTWVSTGLALGVLGLGVPTFGPLRSRAERLVSELLFPGFQQARAMIAEAGPRLARVRGEREAARIVRDLVSTGLHAGSVRVLRADEDGRLVDVLEPEVCLGPPDLLDAVAARAAIDLDGDGPEPPAPVRAALLRLGIRVLAPFPVPADGEPVPGAVTCGERDDGRLYTSEDVEHLEAIAAHAAVAFANARLWRSVRELEERLVQENAWLREEVELGSEFPDIVGSTPGLKQALVQVEQVAPTDATVLVTGETGTGKELLVRALHALSKRSEEPLVKIACAAIPENLLESELFGHEKGAFTGASKAREGRFELADRGTIFFDDVDTLPLAVQAKLLRAIQEGEVQRLGSTEHRNVDVRVIAATNRDLLEEARAGRFREDLYYRLHVVPIEIPPLRDRCEDVAPLAHHFVALESRKAGREPRPLAASAVAALTAYPWPGNIRELRNVIERAVVLSRDAEIELPEPLVAANLVPDEGSAWSEDRPLADQVRDFKRSLVHAALEASAGNQRIAAERLGLHRQSLTRMLRGFEEMIS